MLSLSGEMQAWLLYDQSPRPEEKVEARFFRVMPKEKSDLKRRSKDTEGSPDSILANLDWLVWSAAATAA